MKIENTSPWDVAEHLKTEEDRIAYLEAILEENDAALITAALGDIARAKGMSQIAKQTNLGRESLYNQTLLDEINQAYADDPEPGENVCLSKMRNQHRKIVENEW